MCNCSLTKRYISISLCQTTITICNIITIGDSVIVQPSIITIEITSNDDPHGVFLFSVVSLDITEDSGRNELR